MHACMLSTILISPLWTYVRHRWKCYKLPGLWNTSNHVGKLSIVMQKSECEKHILLSVAIFLYNNWRQRLPFYQKTPSVQLSKKVIQNNQQTRIQLRDFGTSDNGDVWDAQSTKPCHSGGTASWCLLKLKKYCNNCGVLLCQKCTSNFHLICRWSIFCWLLVHVPNETLEKGGFIILS